LITSIANLSLSYPAICSYPILFCPVMCRTLPCLCPSFYSSLFCRMSNVLFVTDFCLASYTTYLFYNIVSVLFHRTFSFILTMFFVSLSTSYPLSNVLHCVLCQYLSWRVMCQVSYVPCPVPLMQYYIILYVLCSMVIIFYFTEFCSLIHHCNCNCYCPVFSSTFLFSTYFSLPSFLYLLFSIIFLSLQRHPNSLHLASHHFVSVTLMLHSGFFFFNFSHNVDTLFCNMLQYETL
jgi:hypothetical protein